MNEQLATKEIDAPQYKDLRDLAAYTLYQRKKLCERFHSEFHMLNETLKMIALKTGLRFDLDKNEIIEEQP